MSGTEFQIPHLEVGLTYGLGAIGMALTFIYLDYPDFTVLGSISLGAIASIWAVGILPEAFFALTVALIVGALLGVFTFYIYKIFKIPLVIAGIVTFVSSSTPAYWLAPDAKIQIAEPLRSIGMTTSFNWTDVLILVIASLCVSILVALLMSTKIGSLILAFDGSDTFIRFRHRYENFTKIIIIGLGNAITGLAGGFAGLQLNVAQPNDHFIMFLPFALGGIASGKAASTWLGDHWLAFLREGNVDRTVSTGQRKLKKRVFDWLRSGRGNIQFVFLSFFSFALATAFIYTLAEAVRNNQMSVFYEGLTIPQSARPITYAVIGLIIAFSVGLSSSKSKKI